MTLRVDLHREHDGVRRRWRLDADLVIGRRRRRIDLDLVSADRRAEQMESNVRDGLIRHHRGTA